MSSAVFHRLSQPREPVRWSKVALITNDMFSVAEARNQNNKGTANGETKDQNHQPGNSYKYNPISITLLCCKWILWLAWELCHYSLLRSSWRWFSISLWELNTKPSNVGVQIFHDATESDGPKTGGTYRMQIWVDV